MAELKTRPTGVPVEAFLDTVTPPQRRADALVLIEIMRRLSGHEPYMWGPTIIGFGKVAYRYESGHGGEMIEIGFSPRKAQLVLYVDGPRQADLLARLGKHSVGKSCLYIRKLADVDLSVVEALVERALETQREGAA
jgi:hypothetical protein